MKWRCRVSSNSVYQTASDRVSTEHPYTITLTYLLLQISTFECPILGFLGSKSNFRQKIFSFKHISDLAELRIILRIQFQS